MKTYKNNVLTRQQYKELKIKKKMDLRKRKKGK